MAGRAGAVNHAREQHHTLAEGSSEIVLSQFKRVITGIKQAMGTHANHLLFRHLLISLLTQSLRNQLTNMHFNGATNGQTTGPTSSLPSFPPGVQRLSATAPPEHFIALLKRDGGVVCENFAPLEIVDKCNAEIKPKLDAEQRWNGDFFPVCSLQNMDIRR